METVPSKNRRGRKKMKQREKTAQRYYDPYFGDMTKISHSAVPQEKCSPEKFQPVALQLIELFPQTEKKLIDLLLDEHHGDFDLVFEALLKINSESSASQGVPDGPSEKPAEVSPENSVENPEGKPPDNGLPPAVGAEDEEKKETKVVTHETEVKQKDEEEKKGEGNSTMGECVTKEEDVAKGECVAEGEDVAKGECVAKGEDIVKEEDVAKGEAAVEEKAEDEVDEGGTHLEEYKSEIDSRALDSIADHFIAKHPRLKREEVLEELKKQDGNIINVRKKLQETHGEECLKPFTEEEAAAKAKSEFLTGYLKGGNSTEEFNEFFATNDMQEQIWKQIKEKTAEQYKEEIVAFEKNFPALSPEKCPPKTSIDKGIWEATRLNNEKQDILEKSFPSLDRRTIEYVMYNFSNQLPQAMSYLKSMYPTCYVDIMKPKEGEELVQNPIIILPAAKPKAFQFQQRYKKREKAQYENPIPNIQRQVESNPGSKYSEIRRDADIYLKMMHIYLKNEAFAHSVGQHSEASKFRKLAQDYCELYSEAKREAMVETINQRNCYNNQLEKVDLHGLHAKEAEEYIQDTLSSIKERLKSGELRPGPQGVYIFKIITGVGKHSRDMRARLQPTVRLYLKNHQYDFAEDKAKGIFEVRI